LPSEKIWVFIFFSPKTRLQKVFVDRKIQSQSITKSPMLLSNKQTDPANVFVENERQSEEKHRSMGNVESVSKNKKIQLYY